MFVGPEILYWIPKYILMRGDNRNCDELPESDLRAPSELPESSQSESSLRGPRERPERSLDASKEPFIKTKAFNRLRTDVKKNLLLTIKWLESAGF